MPTIQLRVAACSKKTAGWLADLLKKQGLNVVYERDGKPVDAVVAYGYGYDKTPKGKVLNGTAGQLDNLQQIEILSVKNNLRTVPLVKDIRKADFSKLSFPMLARTERHDGGGTDIMPVFQAEEIPWRIAAGAKFFTEYIPRKTEYRLWIYRRRLLAAYEKNMVSPEKYKGIGANYKDGFEHEYVERSTIPSSLVDMAAKAVFVMGLDFGGVDILVSKKDVPFILEVNTAPGANGPKAVGLSRLAESIGKWVKLGYPEQSKTFQKVTDAD